MVVVVLIVFSPSAQASSKMATIVGSGTEFVRNMDRR